MKQKFLILSDADRPVYIYDQVSICHNGMHLFWKYKTMFMVKPSEWNAKKEEASPRMVMSAEDRTRLADLNVRLYEFRNFVESRFLEDAANGLSFTRDWMKDTGNMFFSRTAERVTGSDSILDRFDEFIDQGKFADSRVRQYMVLLRSLRRYEMYRQHMGQRQFHLNSVTLTSRQLDDIWDYMKDEPNLIAPFPDIEEAVPYKKKGEVRSINTCSTVFKKLRAFVRWCVRKKYLKENPFDDYHIRPEVYGTPVFITADELHRIYETDLSDKPDLEVMRDIFVFQSNVGCRVGDLFSFRKENVNRGVLTYIPQKTVNKNGRVVTVPLDDTAKAIVRKYSRRKDDSLLPFPKYAQDYNESIKIIFRIAGVDRMVAVLDPVTRKEKLVSIATVAASHMARKTFAGNVYAQVRDPNIVASLTGHAEGSRAFARYRNITMDIKEDALKVFNRKKR